MYGGRGSGTHSGAKPGIRALRITGTKTAGGVTHDFSSDIGSELLGQVLRPETAASMSDGPENWIRSIQGIQTFRTGLGP